MVAPPWCPTEGRPQRPRRTAAERRAQAGRAQARAVQALLRAFSGMEHRGCRPTRLQAALRDALLVAQAGDRCGAHADEAESPTVAAAAEDGDFLFTMSREDTSQRAEADAEAGGTLITSSSEVEARAAELPAEKFAAAAAAMAAAQVAAPTPLSSSASEFVPFSPPFQESTVEDGGIAAAAPWERSETRARLFRDADLLRGAGAQRGAVPTGPQINWAAIGDSGTFPSASSASPPTGGCPQS
ncbi:unnamed protein product [Prorocentrum cordatum]|uniref:Subtilisin n=1 Tax=Prorocentrum cordatum TaxID=2364126 RepID=A0ABN9UTE3_9DINO|nr:unnamed protein product [Polarella glacialis]